MNPATPGVIPSMPLTLNGYVELLIALALVSIVVMFGMLLWQAKREDRRRKRLRCPVRLRPARVLFQIGTGRKPEDVLHCSVFGRHPITCGKACLDHGAHA